MPLTRLDRAYRCPAGHSFDVSRSGYVNLLQPQDRRSLQAGDSRTAVDARAALHQLGIGRVLIDAIIDGISPLLPDDAVVVDLGCGSGEMLGQLCAGRSLAGIGIDLSAAAIDLAARRFPEVAWLVANADRRLPLQDGSVHTILSIHGRRNPRESARVLHPAGFLIVALPAPDDLIELRTMVQGRGVERDRAEGMLHEHERDFQLVERASLRERLTLDRDALVNLLRGTYRGARFKLSDRVEAVQEMEVTSSSELCVLKRKRSG